MTSPTPSPDAEPSTYACARAGPSRPDLDMLRSILEAVPLFGRPDEPIDLAALRSSIDLASGSLALPEGVERHESDLGGMPTDWLTPGDARPGALLYLHGGGYVIGSRASHGGIAAAIAAELGRPVALIEYGLGPESPFPAAIDDAVAAYQVLLADHPPEQLAIAGDSAGGGLTLATLVALRDRGVPLPTAAACLSPWTDLRCEAATMDTRADVDPLCSRERLRQMADLYLDGSDPADPLASPLLADHAGLPPLLIQVGDAEVLLDDSVALEQRATAAGVDVTLEVWDDMIHVFQAFRGVVPEAETAIARIGTFLDGHMR